MRSKRTGTDDGIQKIKIIVEKDSFAYFLQVSELSERLSVGSIEVSSSDEEMYEDDDEHVGGDYQSKFYKQEERKLIFKKSTSI